MRMRGISQRLSGRRCESCFELDTYLINVLKSPILCLICIYRRFCDGYNDGVYKRKC